MVGHPVRGWQQRLSSTEHTPTSSPVSLFVTRGRQRNYAMSVRTGLQRVERNAMGDVDCIPPLLATSKLVVGCRTLVLPPCLFAGSASWELSITLDRSISMRAMVRQIISE